MNTDANPKPNPILTEVAETAWNDAVILQLV